MQCNACGPKSGTCRCESPFKVAQRSLLDEFQNVDYPRARLIRSVPAIRVGRPIEAPTARGPMFVRVDVIEASKADLLEIICALRPASCFARRLDSWKQKRDQNAD